MTWRVVFAPEAERDFKRLPKADKQRIKDEMADLAEEPYAQFYVKNLKRNRIAHLYAYRVGEYRIILTIENGVLVILMIEGGDGSAIHRNH